MGIREDLRRHRLAQELRYLRKTQPAGFEDDPLNEYTQEVLSKRCGIDPETGKPNVPLKTIQNIEQEKPVNLTRVLAHIANALQLYGKDRSAFFHLALTGEYAAYPPPTTTKPDAKTLASLKEDLETLPYPAMVRTPLWDILYVNACHRALWNITSESEALLRQNEGGANLMILRHHQDFAQINTIDRNPLSDVEAILSFQFSARSYQNTKRYRILKCHLRDIGSFKIVQKRAEAYSAEDILEMKFTRKPKYHLHHPEFGVLSITSHRWNDMFNPSGLITSTYMPYADSEEVFERIRRSSVIYPPITEFPYQDYHELLDESDKKQQGCNGLAFSPLQP